MSTRGPCGTALTEVGDDGLEEVGDTGAGLVGIDLGEAEVGVVVDAAVVARAIVHPTTRCRPHWHGTISCMTTGRWYSPGLPSYRQGEVPREGPGVSSLMMREAFVGFDSAWAGKTPGGIAWATFEGGRLTAFTEPKLARFDEAAGIIETLGSECDYVLVAVDQPTLVPNETGSRPVDRIARCLISKLGSGVQPANRGREAFFWLERADLAVPRTSWGLARTLRRRRTSTHGLHLLEVFPALALPSLEPEILKRGRAARYNPTKKTFSCDDWRLVAGCVRCRASALGMAPLSHWAGQQIGLAGPTKCDQDRLDAAICLVVALEWRRAPRDRVAVIGDGRKGYMVTPVSPETRELLAQAAIATGVPFDAAWQDPEWSPNSTRWPRRISMNDRRTAAPCQTRHDETAVRTSRRGRLRSDVAQILSRPGGPRRKDADLRRRCTPVRYPVVTGARPQLWCQP